MYALRSSTCGIKDIAHEMFEIVSGAASLDMIVRNRKPPLKAEAGCVQNPVCNGAGTWRTPSNVVFAEGNEESSDAVGRMNMGDSVKDSDIDDVEEILSKFKEINPPTCR